MMVPRNKLVFWTAVIGAAAAAFWALRSGGLLGALALPAILAVLVCADAWGAKRLLAGLTVTVTGDVRGTVGRSTAVEFVVQAAVRSLRMAIQWPEGVFPTREIMSISLPEDGSAGRIACSCVIRKRGVHRFALARVEVDSALGFWSVRRDMPVSCTLRGYPNLMREQKGLAAIFLNRGLSGIHAQRQLGKGREVEKLREYLPGDSYEDIHWKATAKRGRPITKVFQVERTQEVYVVLDVSRLSARPVAELREDEGDTDGRTQLERFITAAMVMGGVAQRQGDLFGVMAFDDQVRAFVRAGHGRQHYGACRDAIFALQAGPCNPDFGAAFTFLRLRLRRRALVFFLTSVDDPVLAEQFLDQVGIVSRRHLVMVNMLPAPGVAPLFEGAPPASSAGVYEHLAGHLMWHELREMERRLHQKGVSMAMVDHEQLCPQMVSQYVRVRQRQLL